MINLPLETDRLIIRHFIDSDLEFFLSFMLNEESTKYLMFSAEQKTQSGAQYLFNFVCNSYNTENPIYSFAIADKKSNRYLGSCGFAPYDKGIYEIYYSINSSEEGNGLATEAIKAIVVPLAQKVEVRAYCHPQNNSAHNVALKSGFVFKNLATHKNFGNEGYLFIYQVT
ncbi:GNAT family N-acetyltransferase [Hyella patelloides LEGE 07179]|uniref:GNAT family N-acetyltransferase n=2 Tax=Hyella TaxID=945733 RepID=A0A563VP04_9CYAN|nr:GNAT family N-acetyltransferase [Hyella patelloides LEGE 07179]